MRPNALLQVAWNCLHHRTHWSLSHWCQASHQPGQVQRPTRACGKPSRIFQMTATSHCSKNSHNLGHQDVIVPTFPLYAPAKSAVLCHDLPMASKIFSRSMWWFSALGFSHDSHDSLVEHRWSCSKSTGNAFGEVLCHPPPVDMLKWSSFVPVSRNGNSGRWQILMIFWTVLNLQMLHFHQWPFPVILSDFWKPRIYQAYQISSHLLIDCQVTKLELHLSQERMSVLCPGDEQQQGHRAMFQYHWRNQTKTCRSKVEGCI